jgi:hypothetical protein
MSRLRSATALFAVALFGVSLAATGMGSASAAGPSPSTVSDASFAWGLSGEQGGGSFFGGCNFLSAGTAGDTGSSRSWTQSDGFYATQSGGVTVEKPNAAGAYSQPTWATKCTDPNGAPVSAASTASLSKNRVRFTGGTGTVDPASNTATVQWSGSFTSVFYGGLTYWSAANPGLTVHADGSAALTATVSGYGSDMNDATKWTSLAPRTVTLASLHGVTVTATGFTVTPDYPGTFPQSFIDFQRETGQSSYWFTSGGARDAAKPAVPLTVAYTVAAIPTGAPTGTPTPTAAPTTAPTATPTTTPPPAPTTSHPTVNLADNSVAAKGDLAFTAAGFTPLESVSVVVHSNPVTLTAAVADSRGVVSASRTLPANLPAGRHTLIVTGSESKATASSTFTIAATPATPTTPTTAATTAVTKTAANSCQLTAGVKGGSLVWGFKKSFRSYVASSASNSIGASGGAVILNQDLAVPGKPMSGTYQWPFVSSSAYASASSFSVQYGGAIELKYPAHYFDIVIAKPRLVVSGSTGTMYADVTLTVSSPTAAPVVDKRAGVALASLALSGDATSTTSWITRTLHTAIQDIRAFTFNGSAFYQKGAALDDATALLSGCTGTTNPVLGTSPGPTGTTGITGTGGAAAAGTGDSSLVPDVAFRPGSGAGADALPYTGINLGDLLAVAGLALASGLLLIVAGTRRRFHPAGEIQ